MKLGSAIAFFAVALAGAEATKPPMHACTLTLQDLRALQNGMLLPGNEERKFGTHALADVCPIANFRCSLIISLQ